MERFLHLQSGLLALTLAWSVSGARVSAHTLPISFLFVVTDAEYVHVELSFNPFELASFSEMDTNRNGRLDPGEAEAHGDKITRLLLANLALLVDGKKVSAETAGVSAAADNHHATLRAHYRVKARNATITIESNLQKVTSSSHLTQVNCLRGGVRSLAQLDSQSHKATFAPDAPKREAGKLSETSTVKGTTKP